MLFVLVRHLEALTRQIKRTWFAGACASSLILILQYFDNIIFNGFPTWCCVKTEAANRQEVVRGHAVVCARVLWTSA